VLSRPFVFLVASSLSFTAHGFLHAVKNTKAPTISTLQHSCTKKNQPQHRFLHSAELLKMAKLDSPSAQRNKDPIWNVLSSKAFPKLLPKDEGPLKVLEIAAGCGVHCHHFASKLVETIPTQDFLWYPSDPDESSCASIEAYIQESPTLQGKLQPPVDLFLGEQGAIIIGNNNNNPFLNDTTGTLDLILCINMIHISPWTATLGLMQVAGKHLKEGGILFTYGPYKVNGEAVESNL